LDGLGDEMTSSQVSMVPSVDTPDNPDLLTLVITTSPTPSAPATELLSSIFNSFQRHCPGLLKCHVILVIDTYDRVADLNRLKKGTVTAEGARTFAQYKENAKKLVLQKYSRPGAHYDYDELILGRDEAEFGSVAYAQQTNSVPLDISSTDDGRVIFVEPLQRLGFGLGVRSALRLTKTPYVWIQQHDWSLVADIPLAPLLTIMQRSERSSSSNSASDGPDPVPSEPPKKKTEQHLRDNTVSVPVKYVCFPSIRMVSYATSDHVMQFPALRALTNLYKQNFTVSPGSPKIPLTPLFFWHDKPHLASTEHYLENVFPDRASMARGAFIEDTAGHRARTEMKDGQWKKWACWLYYPDDGKKLCVRHLKGRTWRGTDGELEQKMAWMRLGGALAT